MAPDVLWGSSLEVDSRRWPNTKILD